MGEGLSLTAAIAEVGFSKSTAQNWRRKYPEFSEAVERGQAKRQLFLERRLLSADKSAQVSSCIFALKNTGTGDWRDKQELDYTSSDTPITPVRFNLVSLTAEDGETD